MKKIFRTILLLIFLLIPVLSGWKVASNPSVSAQSQEKLDELNDQIDQYQKELNRLGQQANTLSNQIAQFNAQIKLASLKISQTEERITLLGGRIDRLEVSLEALSEAFSSRAVETYKMVRFEDPILVLVSSLDLKEAVTRFHYLKKIQDADRDLLFRLQGVQTDYKEEKLDQEELQQQLEEQKSIPIRI